MMDNPHDIPFLNEIIVFLVVAALVVPVFHRIKVSPVLGYLLAGMVIGPFGFAVIDDIKTVRQLAELGIVFLLFLIGLELSFDRLWTMRRTVFGLGGLQVAVTAAVIGLIAWFWGNSPKVSIILGISLALSSTAVVMQLLSERSEVSSRLGRTSFAIVLFQDLAVVPLLVIVTVLGTGEQESLLVSLAIAGGKAAVAIVLIIIFGRLLLRPLFRLVAGTRSPEVFVAMTLLAIIGTAWLTGLSGLSMALGAFLAGLLFAETEYRHQVEIDIQPFKGLLLGLFFISIGMAIDFSAVADKWYWVAASVVGLIVIKALIVGGLCLAFGLPRSLALQTGLYLGQAGEFAFVAIGLSSIFGLIPKPVGQFMFIVTSFSMMITPFIAIMARRLGEYMESADAAARFGHQTQDSARAENHVIIAGFGRVGQTVAKILEQRNIPYIALDLDPSRIAVCRRQNLPVYYGDARRHEVLARVGADHASAAVITLDQPEAATRTIAQIRDHWPELKIYARARDMGATGELAELGADHVIPETVESSLQLAAQLLNGLGFPSQTVNDIIGKIRSSEYAAFHRVLEAAPDDRPAGGEEPPDDRPSHEDGA